MPACSRCGSTAPNRSCVVCWEPPADEPDAFAAAKEHEEMEQQREEQETP